MTSVAEDLPHTEFWGYLSGVTHALSASLDFESTVATVGDFSLPYRGSWCVLHVPSPGVYGGPSGARLDLLCELAASAGAHGVLCAVTDEMVVAAAGGNDSALRDFRARRIGSLITFPLQTRGQTLGTLTFIGSAAEPPYLARDIDLAKDVSARCAMALDAARLYTDAEKARAIAMQMNERLIVATVQQQDLAEEARDANLATSRFLATMSHEFRTPLNAIVGYTDLIGMGIAGRVSDQQRVYLDKIHASTQHLVSIIDDILDMAKLQADRMKVDRERCVAGKAINEAITLVAPQAAAAGLVLMVAGSSMDEQFYCGDEFRVRQIVTNLLSNAVKFTPPGGSVCIESALVPDIDAAAIAFDSGPWLAISVSDTGMGLEEAEREVVFRPFIQLDSGKTRVRGGTGLGLTISRELARHMGGDLTVTSVKGVGSCFTLWLPRGAADEAC